MEFKNIVIAGGGVLGSQISLICAYAGLNTTILIRPEDAKEQTLAKIDRYSSMMLEDLENSKAFLGESAEDAIYPHGLIADWEDITNVKIDALKMRAKENFASKLYITQDRFHAFENADLVIEAVNENPEVKMTFYDNVRDLLPEKTIMVTNSSTLLPSRFAEHTGRPEKYCALHFANTIWRCNTAEIMGHAGTDPEVLQKIIDFAKGIHMIPLPLHKEQPGYILNSVLVPWLAAAESLWVNHIADPEIIDLTWKVGLGMPFGPFEHIDVIGLDTVYNVNQMKADAKVEGSTINRICKLLKEKIDRGETGVNAGKGFYDYQK